jgi:hypothetical protein
MRTLILFVVLFEISSCATFTPGNIVYDKVNPKTHVVSSDGISVSIRLLNPEEANQVLGNRFRQYDYRSGHTTFYKPVVKYQTLVLSILNERNDSINFYANETNNFAKQEAIYELIKDRTGESFTRAGVLCGTLSIVAGAALASNPVADKSGAATAMFILGGAYFFSIIPAVSNQNEVNNSIKEFLEKIAPEKMDIPPHEEKQIVVFRYNPAFPKLVYDKETETFVNEKGNEIFVNKSSSEELKLYFKDEVGKRIEIKAIVKD